MAKKTTETANGTDRIKELERLKEQEMQDRARKCTEQIRDCLKQNRCRMVARAFIAEDGRVGAEPLIVPLE